MSWEWLGLVIGNGGFGNEMRVVYLVWLDSGYVVYFY